MPRFDVTNFETTDNEFWAADGVQAYVHRDGDDDVRPYRVAYADGSPTGDLDAYKRFCTLDAALDAALDAHRRLCA
jgi:hypothetical protein